MHQERLGQALLIITFFSSVCLGSQAVDTSKSVTSLRPIVIPELSHDISPPLRESGAAINRQTSLGNQESQRQERKIFSASQNAAKSQVAATISLNFEGIDAPKGTPYPTPDPNGAVGATQYVQAVNTYLAVFNKSNGALQLGPVSLSSLWKGMSAPCGTSSEGDPIVQYDKVASRWVISHHATQSSGSYYQCIAVSTTSDATGTFYRYAFSVGSLWPDFPKMGVWPDGYYFTYDLLNQNNNYLFANEMACAYDRNSMLQGSAATSVCFQLSSSYGPRVLPADLDICPACSTGSLLPPAGEPDFFLNYDYTHKGLNLWEFHVDFQTPSNSTFTGPTFLATDNVSPACPGGYHYCVPQLGTTQDLDVGGAGTLPAGLSYRVPYRHFPGGPEVLLAVHPVLPQAGLQWYEIRNPANSPWIRQQATFGPDSSYRWNASIAMDQSSDIAMGYSVSSSSINPAIRYTGRVANDPLATMESESSIIEGTGSEVGSSRWGDYSSLSVDPTDDCTFWYTGEYLKTSGDLNWNTRIAAFKFPSCP